MHYIWCMQDTEGIGYRSEALYPHLDEKGRRRGGGRKLETEQQPSLPGALESLVAPAARGDPERPLLWVSKGDRHLANGLGELGFSVSPQLVGRLLDRLGYPLQANVKTRDGTHHRDRDAQFEHINDRVTDFLAAGHQQMEPHRTPPVFVHQPKLAWQAVADARHHRQPDRRDHDKHGTQGLSRCGP